MPKAGNYVKALLLGLVLLAGPLETTGQARVDELRAGINSHTQKIQALEREIAEYQKSLAATSQETKTLKGELARIDTERKKLAADISLTENKIEQTELNLERLGIEIGDKDESISDHQSAVRASLRKLREMDQESLLEVLLAENSFSRFVVAEEQLNRLQANANEQIATLRDLRVELTDRQTETTAEQRRLVTLNTKLADQKKIVDQNRKEKDTLLAETENTEANYRKLLASRQAQKEAFERELFAFESQLRIAIDQSKLPARGSKALSWPLDSIFVTQQFGKTADSGRLYASGTHNGVDFRAPIGTPVKAAAEGVITATGNTDEQSGCYSYGRWVLMEHPNGLSTLYAHLSLTKVVPGQNVARGELIAYSGNTGYSTGPHLHLTAFATEGVRVQKYTNSINCKNVTIPIADPKAYLDPMSYF
jgi:murein DD-endopeptidase MepM/ murein hydrolase activator NlpD